MPRKSIWRCQLQKTGVKFVWAAANLRDAGNAMDRFSDPLAYSVGLGFRLRLPVVTVGVDVAQALRAPGFDHLPGPRLHLNISPKL